MSKETENDAGAGLLSRENWEDFKLLSGRSDVVLDNPTINEIKEVVDKLGFAGYMRGPVAISPNGNPVAAKTKTFNDLNELFGEDFSKSYLYEIYKVRYKHYLVPEGTNAWDYDMVELEKFDMEDRYGYKIRYATEE